MNTKLKSASTIFVVVLAISYAAHAAAPTDPCSLLTQAQVSAGLGVSVDPANRIAPTMCGWSAPKQPNSTGAKKVALLISNANAFGFAKTPVVNSETAAPAGGICDDAVYSFPTGMKSGPATALFVKKGSSYFTVHVYGFPDQAKTMALEKALAVQACSKL